MRTNTVIALLAGVVIGAAAVIAYENGKLIKSTIDDMINKAGGNNPVEEKVE